MPTYSLADVHYLVREGAYAFVTPKSRADVRSLGLTQADAAQLLLLLDEARDFRKVFPINCRHELGESMCDDYLLWVDFSTMQRCSPDMGEKLYIKLAIDSHPDDGEACLVISFHAALR